AEVTLVDIGIPDAATRYVGEGDLDLIRREIDSHKGENGEILVVGGGPYTGAPALTSMAALRSGCDLVRVACPESVADRIQGYSPNLITHSLTGNVITGDNVEKIIGIGEGCDSVVLGPGLGDADETVEAAGELIEAMDRLVVDADAITAVDGVDTDGKDVLITPHAGELGQFVEVPENLEGRTEVVKEFSKDRGLVTLLKGRNDVVSDGDDVRISRTGNPGMTVGGTGDVLAGISGFLSTQIDLMDAGCIAAFVNGRAGDEAFDCYGDGLTANDVIDKVPVAFEDR
ncbi:MAG: NAD(P)H-hydrate dehydratase, partial [Halobacteria archaeon]